MASAFCSQTAPDFVHTECGLELGGIIAAVFIDKDQAEYSKTDLSTRSFWTTKIAVTPNAWWVVKDTRGSYAGGTPVEEEGFGRASTIRTGADHEANLEVPGVLLNRDFWAVINQTVKWDVILIDNQLIGRYIQDVSVYAKQVVDQNIKSLQRMGVNLKWSDDLSNPVVFDATPMEDLYTL